MNALMNLGELACWLKERHDVATSIESFTIPGWAYDHDVFVPVNTRVDFFECDVCFNEHKKLYEHYCPWRGFFRPSSLLLNSSGAFSFVIRGYGICFSGSVIPCSRILALRALWDCRRDVLRGFHALDDRSFAALRSFIERPLVSLVAAELEK